MNQQTGKPSDLETLYIVGIGASAGGLESLQRFIEPIPVDSGMAFVVIQHLSPDFKSMMDELLARRTRIPVRLADNGMKVQANTIYLLPPKKEMVIADGQLWLTEKQASKREIPLPIDRFFTSLAQQSGVCAIGIILSGTGSDGSRGIQAIHDAGGLVLAESEHTAKFNGMPLSAQATGVVDHVLSPELMGTVLLKHSRRLAANENDAGPENVVLEGRDAIFDLLRTEHDIDFAYYKPNTVARRIQRRIAMQTGVEEAPMEIDAYVDCLRHDERELHDLYADLLIGVTRFFRDQQCFETLEHEIVPNLLQNRDANDEIRVWVAGCATGEEAYSMAILLHEALTARKRPLNVKIFATDVHEASLAFASAGIFNEERLVDVSETRLKRYFVRKPEGMQVSKDLRQMIVFAAHNVFKDAPFTKLDLISCRNLLIYLQPQAQRRAVSLFNFALNDGGILFLGMSETPGELGGEFETLAESCKIYRKQRAGGLPVDLQLPLSRTPLQSGWVPQRAVFTGEHNALLDLYDRLLDRFMPSSLLINERRQLIDSYGGAERFLRFKPRRPSNDILELLDGELKNTVAGGIRRAEKERKTIRYSGITLSVDGTREDYALTIETLPETRRSSLHFLLMFEPLASNKTAAVTTVDTASAAMDRERIDSLDEELRYTKENLQAIIEEMETSNEELQATNEELIASNEELQSTNEELNSVNEELYTVNSEYQNKIKELKELNEDINHLLEGADIGTVFLDQELCIRRFTPQIAELFELLPQDIGRRLNSFSHRLDYPELFDDIKRVIAENRRMECEVQDVQGRYYLLRVLPYIRDGGVDGAVVTLTDITTLEEARARLRLVSAIVESSEDAIIGKDLNGIVTSWNAGAQRLFGYSAQEAIGQDLRDLIVPPNRFDEVAEFIARLRNGEGVVREETKRVCKDGRLVDISVTISPVKDAKGRIIGASAIDRDVTARNETERQLRISEQKYQDLYNHAPDMYLSIDTATRKILECNQTLLDRLGYARDEIIGHSSVVFYPPASQQVAQQAYEDFMVTGEVRDVELEVIRKDGSCMDVSLNASAVRDAHGAIVRSRSVWRDLSAQKRAERDLLREVQRREQFLAMLSHELRNPLYALQNAVQLQNSPEADAEAVAQAGSIVSSQIAQMTRLLDDLLDVARMTQNRLALRRERINLGNTVVEAIEAVRSLFSQRGVELIAECESIPLWVFGDSARLQQVQTNLLDNAAKYSGAGKRVYLRLYRSDEQAVISVRDEGIGIPQEKLDQIFELFVQLDCARDPSSSGMGVGLTLVRTIVEMHGGRIEVHSEGNGSGSEFKIHLPLLENGGEVTEAEAGRAPQPRPARVALIEDMEASRTTLQKLLELKGYEVYTAADGSEGLDLILRIRPQLALIDIGLPVMDGYELARRIRATPQGRSLFMVALTGYGQPSDVEQAQQAGFDEHIVKPVNVDHIIALLSQHDVRSD